MAVQQRRSSVTSAALLVENVTLRLFILLFVCARSVLPLAIGIVTRVSYPLVAPNASNCTGCTEFSFDCFVCLSLSPPLYAVTSNQYTRITSEDLGSDSGRLLLVKGLQESDSGVYRCTAAYASSQKLEAHVNLTTIGLPFLFYRPIMLDLHPNIDFEKR